MIDTEDLPSYYPGYDEYCEPKSVSYDFYQQLQTEYDQLEQGQWELEEILKNIFQSVDKEDWKELKAYVEEDCKEIRKALCGK